MFEICILYYIGPTIAISNIIFFNEKTIRNIHDLEINSFHIAKSSKKLIQKHKWDSAFLSQKNDTAFLFDKRYDEVLCVE